MRRFFSFLIGIISGAFVGAVAVLMFTPESGEDLRTQVRGRFQNLIEDVRTAAEEERRRLESQLEAFKQGEIPVEE